MKTTLSLLLAASGLRAADTAFFESKIVDVVSDEGLLVDEDADVGVLAGPPGGFFGRHTAAALEGRWRDDAPDGVWCAYRRGHGDGNWLPTLVSVDGSERRALDLFDHDEWRWALLARSRAVGVEEFVERTGVEVHVTWPPPHSCALRWTSSAFPPARGVGASQPTRRHSGHCSSSGALRVDCRHEPLPRLEGGDRLLACTEPPLPVLPVCISHRRDVLRDGEGVLFARDLGYWQDQEQW